MAIQNRRGLYEDFDPGKMLPGEWAVPFAGDPNSVDGRSVYVCFEAGVVKRMATYEDMKQNISEATEDVSEEVAERLEASMTAATEAANNAAETTNEIKELARTQANNARIAAAAASAAAREAADAAEKAKNDYYGSFASFPETGVEGKLYIDTSSDERAIYVWDDESSSYQLATAKGVYQSGNGLCIPVDIEPGSSNVDRIRSSSNDGESMIQDTACRGMLADEYSATRTYSKGELTIEGNRLYEATQAISAPEAFTESHWSETSLDVIRGAFTSALNGLLKTDWVVAVDSTTVKAGAVYNTSYAPSKPGYTCVGVIGYNVTGTKAEYANVYGLTMNAGFIDISLRNTNSAAATITLELGLLYVKG